MTEDPGMKKRAPRAMKAWAELSCFCGSEIINVIGAAVPKGVVHVGDRVGCLLARHGLRTKTQRRS